jgi:uncharacterized membrane protein YdjX (TVP38/TMEM64 family)
MADNDGSSAPNRRRHIVRLALFAAFVLGLFYLVGVARVIDVEGVRRAVAATGPAAPLAYIAVSAVLGTVFVPGPILAAGSGVLFGPVLGTFVTLGATVGTATVAGLVGRRAGRESARALLGSDRASWLDAQIERRGLWAVVGQRFIPGISDALASYAFGAFGVPLWQMAVGAFIGSAPRAFVYTALGASRRYYERWRVGGCSGQQPTREKNAAAKRAMMRAMVPCPDIAATTTPTSAEMPIRTSRKPSSKRWPSMDEWGVIGGAGLGSPLGSSFAPTMTAPSCDSDHNVAHL